MRRTIGGGQSRLLARPSRWPRVRGWKHADGSGPAVRHRCRDTGLVHGLGGWTNVRHSMPPLLRAAAPGSFPGLGVGKTFHIALPLCSAARWDPRLEQRDRWWLTIMGRLKP